MGHSRVGIIYSQQLDLAQLDTGSEELRMKQRAVTEAQSTLEQTRDTVVLKTIEAYSNLLTTKALLAQAEADLQQAQSTLALVEGQVKAGMKGESSLQEAKLEVLNAQIALEQYRSTYAADKAAFGRLTLGIDGDYELMPIELSPQNLTQAAAELVNEEEILAAAILNAPEVQAAQEKIINAKENLRVVQADALPEMSLEAVLICSIGGFLGLGLGSLFGDWPFVISIYPALLACGFSIAIGLIFGLYPALRAARLDPVEALRYE